VHRDRADVVDDGHRAWVHDSAERTLTQQTDVLQRLKDADAGADVDDLDDQERL
jgi:hypothetical protein